MELDRALELAVISSWEDLVKPSDACSMHVEYENILHVPLRLLEVWAIRNRGYGTLVCRYSLAANNFNPLASEDPAIRFANSYYAPQLADSLNFIIRNQGRFTWPPGRGVHGLVRVDCPVEEDRSDARAWSQSVFADFAQTPWN